MENVTPYNKAIIAAAVAILFWVVEAVQTGDWSNFNVIEGAVTTLFVYLIPNVDKT